ncbi:hypothetical protein OAD26_00475, partial [bacterium]|nr:hypothetical protein [bacterium]
TAEPQVLAAETETPIEEVITLETERTEGDDTSEDSVAPATFETINITQENTENTPIIDDLDVTSTPEMTEITEVVEQVPEDIVVIELDHASTSREGVPAVLAPIEPGGGPGTGEVSTISKMLLSSGAWLPFFYLLLTLFVIVAASLSVFIEWQRQHPIQIAYGAGLVMLMMVLYSAHTALTNGATIL